MDTQLVTMTPGLLRELQLKQLDMLKFFKQFCEENNITFYFIGGGLIGALRNGGFIPWDDDVDLLLPRDDYERLCRLWQEKYPDGRFRLLRTDGKMFTGNIFATVTDTNYTMVKANQTKVDIPHGLVIDVFPLDVCPDGNFARKMQYFWTMLYSLFQAQIVPENHGGLMSLGSKLLLGIFRGKKIREKLWRTAEKHMKQYMIQKESYTLRTREQSIQKTCPILILSLEDSLVSRSASVESAADSRTPEERCSLKLPVLPRLKDLSICCLKMYPDCLTTTPAGHLQPSSVRWTNWGMMSHGKCLTAKITECRKPDAECTLSDIIEKNVQEKYYLSHKQVNRLLYS